MLVLVRRKNPELTKLALAQGNLVLNGGAYVVHRRQLIANEGDGGTCANGAPTLGCPTENVGTGYVRRGASAWIPNLWLQLLYKKFRFEAEVVTVQGSIESTPDDAVNGRKIRMWGFATEFEQKLVEDRLKLEFKTGWASGDPDVYGPVDGAGGLSPGFSGLQPQLGDDTISTFRFHPNYKVDMILHRNLLSRVQGTYYFRPSVEYDFIREPSGQRFGGGFAGIWTRASEFVQTPGHKRDLGIELNLSLYYQSKDGALNDNHDQPGGFYTMLQWGVLFPMGGLGHQEEESRAARASTRRRRGRDQHGADAPLVHGRLVLIHSPVGFDSTRFGHELRHLWVVEQPVVAAAVDLDALTVVQRRILGHQRVGRGDDRQVRHAAVAPLRQSP